MATISVLNTDSDLTSKTLVTAEGDRTITGNYTFNRSPSAPFVVQAGSANVTNLDADKLDGQHGSFYQNASNLNTGTVPTAQLGSGTASSVSGLMGDSTWQPFVGRHLCQGRLTLSTGVPVTSADVTAATTLYFTPYGGNAIGLYDGSTGWNVLNFSEISIAVPATTQQMYDVFVFNNAGTAALELLAWTNDTTRATALVLQDGVWVKTGATTRRYVGSFRTTTVSGQTEDSVLKRHVWNYYNRVRKSLRVTDAAASWNYSTNTWRQANSNSGNQVSVVVGVAEEAISLNAIAMCTATGATDIHTGIGEDSTTTPAGFGGSSNSGSSSVPSEIVSTLMKMPAVGYHFYAWLEKSNAIASGNTVTFVGSGGQTVTGVYGLWAS